MPDTMLNRGVDFLASRLAAATEETARLERPRTQQVREELAVTPGTQDFQVVQSDQTVMTFQSYDWLCAAEDYDFGTGAVKPEAGDRFVVYRRGKRHTYEVLRDSGVPAFDYSDPYHRRLRVHTKLIETE